MKTATRSENSRPIHDRSRVGRGLSQHRKYSLWLPAVTAASRSVVRTERSKASRVVHVNLKPIGLLSLPGTQPLVDVA